MFILSPALQYFNVSKRVKCVFKLMLGLCEQEAPSSSTSLMPFSNPSCPSWRSECAPPDPGCSDLVRQSPLTPPLSFPGKWTPSSTGWTRPKRRWPPTSTWCGRSCGRSLPHQLLLPLLAPKKRRPRPGKERTASSAPDVSPESFCVWWNYSLCVWLHVNVFLSLDSNCIILKKTDMEAVFNLFQNCKENKTLVYVSVAVMTSFIWLFFFLIYQRVVWVFDPVFSSRCCCRSCWGNYFLMNISWMWAQLPFRKSPTPHTDLWSHNDVF